MAVVVLGMTRLPAVRGLQCDYCRTESSASLAVGNDGRRWHCGGFPGWRLASWRRFRSVSALVRSKTRYSRYFSRRRFSLATMRRKEPGPDEDNQNGQ